MQAQEFIMQRRLIFPSSQDVQELSNQRKVLGNLTKVICQSMIPNPYLSGLMLESQTSVKVFRGPKVSITMQLIRHQVQQIHTEFGAKWIASSPKCQVMGLGSICKLLVMIACLGSQIVGKTTSQTTLKNKESAI